MFPKRPSGRSPFDPALPPLAAGHRLVAVVEDNGPASGVGAAGVPVLGDAEVDVPVRRFALPEQFLTHAGRGEVRAGIGLTPVGIAGRISACLAAKDEVAKDEVAKDEVAKDEVAKDEVAKEKQQ